MCVRGVRDDAVGSEGRLGGSPRTTETNCSYGRADKASSRRLALLAQHGVRVINQPGFAVQRMESSVSVAYFIVLDNKDPGFNPFVNGKAVAHAREAICAITERLGLKGIDDLTSFGEFDEEFDVPEECRETETPWFEPQEGIDWIDAIREHIETNSLSVKHLARVLEDLDEYREVLQRASKIGAKWHFQMDL